MLSLDYTRYYSNMELEQVLHSFVQQFPQLARLESIGKSFEGRDLWLMTLTNCSTGEPRSKPSLWLDGNIHATEITGCMAALHLIDTLLNGYASDSELQHLLDSSTFYVLPRFNPDGAERIMSSPHRVRSSVRPYPREERQDGLYLDDVNGDGVIATMRVPDTNGDWKISDQDPRVMIKRRPDEIDGSFYWLFPEGVIQNFDGVNVKQSPQLEGLDINRNFPGNWRPENEQFGAGPFPTSEPEIRAVVEFVTSHPEIHSAITYHTFSGVLLRPYGHQADDAFDVHDLAVYKAIGERGTELTGYPHASVYHDFRYHPKEVISGVFDDWCYDYLGMFAWTVEFWDLVGEAGIKDRDFIEWFRNHPDEDEYALMKWNDEHVAGSAFHDWQPFEHPQLGSVEIGGWDSLYAFRNPPPAFLEETCEKGTKFTLAHAKIAPLLKIQKMSAKLLSADLFQVELVLQNLGFLPTYGSRQAKQRKACLPLEVSLLLPDQARLENGKLKQEIDHLEGRSVRLERMNSSATSDRTSLQWVVRAPSNTQISVSVSGGRGGAPTASIMLGDDE